MKITTHVRRLKTADYIAEYRDIARFSDLCRKCPKYGSSWHCPPYDYDVRIIDKFSFTHLFAAQVFGFNNYTAAINAVWNITHPVLMRLEQQYPDSMAFDMTCQLCGDEQCSRIDNLPCRHPEQMRHSIESFGFDIAKTTKELFGIPLLWSKDGSTPEYLVFVTALFTNHDIDTTNIF